MPCLRATLCFCRWSAGLLCLECSLCVAVIDLYRQLTAVWHIWFKIVTSNWLKTDFRLENGQCGLSPAALSALLVMLLWPSLFKFLFCCMQIFVCCVVVHVKRFWASIDPSCKHFWFREAKYGFISMCASLWRGNQVLVLWGCGAETTALAPGLMFCACWCGPYTDPTESETSEI